MEESFGLRRAKQGAYRSCARRLSEDRDPPRIAPEVSYMLLYPLKSDDLVCLKTRETNQAQLTIVRVY